MSESEIEPNEELMARLGEMLSAAQTGQLVGLISICFLSDGNLNVKVAGEQTFLARLGSLVAASDVIKLLQAQGQQQLAQRAQQANWGPGGNA